MNGISPGQFISTWMGVVDESWMDEDTIVEKVAVELNVTTELVRVMINKWKAAGKKLPGSDK